jgi:hypothetical protein
MPTISIVAPRSETVWEKARRAAMIARRARFPFRAADA